MNKKIGIHLLTAFPPSNPNRDETGQPKTAYVGGKLRQRISSQCIKRAWRISDVFQSLEANFSTRTREIGKLAFDRMMAAGMKDELAKKNAEAIATAFGKVEAGKLRNKEVVVLGHEELAAVEALCDVLISEDRAMTEAEAKALPRETRSIDVALFGRMRASRPEVNVDASVAVSHPLTVGVSKIEDDLWTSVDDLQPAEDIGSGGMGNVEFGSGTYYTYIEVNVGTLLRSLHGDVAQAKQAVAALVKAAATVTPGGFKNSFGNAVRASFVRVEVGEPSGNLMMNAFEKPADGTGKAIEALQTAAIAQATGFALDQVAKEFIPGKTDVSLADLMALAESAVA